MKKQEMVNKFDEVLGAEETGFKVVGDAFNREVYVRANRVKKSRIKDFINKVKELGLPGLGSPVEGHATGEWIETDKQIAVLDNKYYMVVTQTLNC